MKTYFMSAVVFVSSIICSLSSPAEVSSCAGFYTQPSVNYKLWLETDSSARTKWISKESGTTLRELHESKNYQVISDAVLSQNSKATTLSFDGNSKANYELRFMGLTKPQVLYRITKEGRSEILTTDSLTKDTSFSLLQAYATPKDSHIILVASDNGNIDVFQTYVYDLKTKKIVKHFQTAGQQITWKNESEFFFFDADKKLSSENGPILSLYNLKTGLAKAVNDQNLMFIDKNSYIKMENGHAHLIVKNKPKIFLPKSIFNTDISINSLRIRENGDLTMFANDSWNNKGKVLKYTRTHGKGRWETLYETPKDSVIESVQFNEDHIAISLFWGPSVVTKILTYSGQELAQVKVPSCCLMNHVAYKDGADIIDVTLSNHFKPRATFKFSLKENRFLDPTVEKQMLSHDGIDYTSAIHWATSKDGAKIPVRLTYRRDLLRNSQNPLLIYGYGGFMLAGYLNSFNSKMDAFFIKNGGIIAGPALRGGNEYGKQWHEAAMFEKKHKTMEDFVASAELVHTLNLSSPEITAIQGWSNGGFIASATGLLYPHVIGIVVSGNGVNDQTRKEVLNPEFGNGWAYEYGDSRNPDVLAYLKNWSSVYRAQLPNITPQMLIVNGRKDSRVNLAHSVKLAYALKENSTTPNNVYLMSIPNSGHFMTSVAYQNSIAWKAQTLIWTFLYDKMKMTAVF